MPRAASKCSPGSGSSSRLLFGSDLNGAGEATGLPVLMRHKLSRISSIPSQTPLLSPPIAIFDLIRDRVFPFCFERATAAGKFLARALRHPKIRGTPLFL
jgi:hypothetical protein